jgi:hypothetical protein
VVAEPGLVVVVEPLDVGVVVVAPPLVLVVVVDDDGWVVLVVVLELVDVVVLLDELVEVVVVDAGGGALLKTPPSEVPVPACPKMDESGLPAISSTPVTTRSATRKTTPAVPAMAFQVKRREATGATEDDDEIRWVAGVPATAVASSCSVRSAGEADPSICVVSSAAADPVADDTTSVGVDDSCTSASVSPPTAVAPSLRRTESSGARTTTCLTASWPRSMDCATNAVPMVAATDPMATPTTVPLTPKADAMRAARTAPTAEARIWRMENFTDD